MSKCVTVMGSTPKLEAKFRDSYVRKSLKSDLFSGITMNSNAVKLMMVLIMDLGRPEIDHKKIDQLVG